MEMQLLNEEDKKVNLLAERITEYFIRNGITTEEMREENIYGLEVLMGKIVNYTTLIVLSFWKHNTIPMICFMIVFFSLRGRTGGFHASTRINCYFGTIIMFFLITEIFVPLIKLSLISLIVTLIISDIIIFLLAPVNHPNLSLSNEEIKDCKNVSRWLVILFTSLAIVLYEIGIIPECISYMVIGIGADAGLLIVAKTKKQEGTE